MSRVQAVLTLRWVAECHSDLTLHTLVRSGNNLELEVRTEGASIAVNDQITSSHWVSTDHDRGVTRDTSSAGFDHSLEARITVSAVSDITDSGDQNSGDVLVLFM